MRSSLCVAALLMGLSSVSALGQTASTMSSGTAPVGDGVFVKKATVSDTYEIAAGRIAETKATSADVKTFANRMITDHTKSSDQLKSILSKKGHTPAPPPIDPAHKAMLNKLRNAGAQDFDSLYAQQQIQAHQEAVMLYTSEQQSGTDPDIKNFAVQTLPVIQQHLSMAQQLPKGGAAH
jgi:putative membrane protein